VCRHCDSVRAMPCVGTVTLCVSDVKEVPSCVLTEPLAGATWFDPECDRSATNTDAVTAIANMIDRSVCCPQSSSMQAYGSMIHIVAADVMCEEVGH
jgi:hypothetical protein